MNTKVLGIHHVTAIAGSPQRNLDFYTGTLGLRLVKHTVNFDDPTTYHLYFGDELGRPGSLLTFFPFPGARSGRQGVGQVTATGLAIAPRAIDFWLSRLAERGVPFAEPRPRFEEQVIALADPDGLPLELVAHPGAEPRGTWARGGIPAEFAIHGVHQVTLTESFLPATAELLTGVLGFRAVGAEGSIHRFAAGDGGPGTLVDVLLSEGGSLGSGGAGTVHHVAFRAENDAAQLELRRQLLDAGVGATAVIDRQYFHSIYFREPGGVLFEVATDNPGFAIDEPVEQLGTTLRLPPQYEPRRASLEAVLPPLRLPRSGEVVAR